MASGEVVHQRGAEGVECGGKEGSTSSATSRRRWDLLRSVLLKKEVDLREYADITTRTLADLQLFSKEKIESGDGYVKVRYGVSNACSLTLKQSEEQKLKVKSLSELRTRESDADRTGIVTVWPSEEALGYVCSKRAGAFEGKVVVEVGSGLGLAGLAIAATTKAKLVVLTDGNSDAVSRLRENIALNAAKFGDTVVRAEKLDWSDAGLRTWWDETSVAELGGGVDHVLCADCIYHKELFRPLSGCLDFLLTRDQQRGTECWLMCPNRHGGHSLFLQVLGETAEDVEDSGWTIPPELGDHHHQKTTRESRGLEEASYPRLCVLAKKKEKKKKKHY